jgi:hypothetical protein
MLSIDVGKADGIGDARMGIEQCRTAADIDIAVLERTA